jgi:benzodiazapine receptor
LAGPTSASDQPCIFKEVRVFQYLDPNEWGSYPGASAPVSPVLALVGFVGLCLLVGAADGALIAGAPRGWYLSLIRPPGTPPDWLFGPVWTVLYAMIGLAGWLVWRRTTTAWPLRLWGWQLAANALWTPAFFALHSPPLALAVCLVLLALIVLTIRSFARLRRSAAWLMAPYLAWTCYATYLTAGFWWLNPS